MPELWVRVRTWDELNTIRGEGYKMEAITPWTILIIIFIVLAFCLPFFIYKIRNQVVEMNKKMVLMTEYLRMIAYGTKEERELRELDDKGREIKTYPECRKPNHPKDIKCIHCGYGFLAFK